LQDSADAEKDQNKCGGAFSHLLRSCRSDYESKERKIAQHNTNRSFGKFELIQEREVQ
jgi:hypothetical protein